MHQNFTCSPWKKTRQMVFQNSDQNNIKIHQNCFTEQPIRKLNLDQAQNIKEKQQKDQTFDRFIPSSKINPDCFQLLINEELQNLYCNNNCSQNQINFNLNNGDQTRNTISNGINDSQNNNQQENYTQMLRNTIIQNENNKQLINLFQSQKKNSIQQINNIKNSNNVKVFQYKTYIKKFSSLSFQDDNEQIVFNTEHEKKRKILDSPYKILDAPGLSGDFYTNVLEWSAQNLIIVGLNNYVYTWSPQKRNSNNIIHDLTYQTNIQSISSNWDGHLLAAADETGEIKIYDFAKQAIFQQYKPHDNKIGAIAWNNNLLTTACKDSSIKIRDIRQKMDIQTLNFHKDQVCGIKWSCDGNNLASGGNDNKLYVFSLKMNKRISSLKSHVGAVKALAWSPHNQNILVSGGGNKDQTLKFWNIQTNQLIKSIHTGSQICNMHYSKNFNEIVTTHGFQLNQISLWNVSDYSQIATLYGHQERVLYLAASPDQEDIVTGSADETLRFWKVFPSLPKIDTNNEQSKLNPLYESLR